MTENRQGDVSTFFNSDCFTSVLQDHEWRKSENQPAEPIEDELQQIADSQERIRSALERLRSATSAMESLKRQADPEKPITRLTTHRIAKARSEMADGRQMIREAMAKLPQR